MTMPATDKDNSTTRLNDEAKKFGCPDLIDLGDRATPEHLEYLDLLPGKPAAPLLPDAVAEFQGRPILYLLDGIDDSSESQPAVGQIRDLQQLLANRSEHACLGIVRPGELRVYPINLNRQKLEQAAFKIITIADPAAPLFFQSLATGALELQGQPKAADYVFDEIHHLLSEASKELTGQLQPLEVLSVAGRALFFRFLHDRHIVLPDELTDICPQADELKDVFSNAEKAAATSCWLDETFNGDLLPLVPGLAMEASTETRLNAYRQFYHRIGDDTGQRVFRHLEAILRGWRSVGGSSFQLTIDWGDFDFAHIPVGVLSQVYETFSRQWDEAHAVETGVYYTPKNIARLLVEEALAGIDDPAEARILDPACGAGVFLVLAFQHLVRKRWEKDDQRPDTHTIQRILYNQIRGFDVSESALRLAALALYITAIEVNGTTRPPESLKFPGPLQNEVLFNFGQHATEGKRRFILGSLGPEVPPSFNGAFDVVVTNPPWTRLRASSKDEKEKSEERADNDAMNREFSAITRRVLKARNIDDLAHSYTNPDNNPDLPFLWRSTEWTKPGGVIAMALPARIILKQSGKGKAARDAIMRGLVVNGIINGSDLEETKVWPNMKLPFMLLFARNSAPLPDHHFYFATPVRESRLCNRGQFRMDYQSAEPVSARQVIEKPWLLKALAVGTCLDSEIVERLQAQEHETVGSLWEAENLYSGKGYDISATLSQASADNLLDLLDFEEPESSFKIEWGKLKKWGNKYNSKTAHMPRDRRLWQPPLLIIPKAPGVQPTAPRAFRSLNRELCFSQSYYGFSSNGHVEADVLVSLLYLITHSRLFQHFCLMCSSSIGASWRIFVKEDLETFPFPNPAKLTTAQKQRILVLAEALESAPQKPWDAIDDFIFQLYGLDEHDATVVRDTVTFGAPYRTARIGAENPPNSGDIEIFRSYLEDMLQPYFEVAGQRVEVAVLPPQGWNPPWRFLTICLAGDNIPMPPALLVRLTEEANRTAASRVVMPMPESGLLLGLLNQGRFWTRSRARLCGLHIVREHLATFPLPNSA